MTKKNVILLLFIVLKFVLQYFAIDSGYELHRDEYLHLDLGKHLAWGYTSVPPLTGIISFCILMLGNSVFWVKFFPALFGALTIFVVWKCVEELKGGLFSLILASVCVMFSVLLRINTLYQPNSLDILFWTVVFYMLVKYINTENSKWLYFASLAFAIGFLNKYNITFLLLGLAPAFLLTKQRSIFASKHLYYAAVMALVIVLPNLLWQYNNDFPVFHHLKELTDTQLVNVSRLDFLKEQLLFFTGGLLLIVLAFVSFFTFGPFKKFKVLFFTFLITMIIFVYFRAKNYYSIGLYPIFIAFGAVYLESLLKNGWLRFLRILFIISPIVTFISMYQIMLPVLSPEQILDKKELFEKYNLTRWNDGKIHDLPQDFADMTGWKELANIVDSAFFLMHERDFTIIHCDNYGQAGAINFYRKQTYANAYSMNADYINWYPFDEFEIRNVILVQEASDTDVNREKERPLFEKITFVGEIKNKNAMEFGTKVYLLEGAKQSINEILKAEIAARRNNHK